MLSVTKLRGALLTAALAVAILPLRPLIIALGVQGSGAQQCLLHGAGCQCTAHCDRAQQRHAHHEQEPAAKPACHHDTAGDEPPAGSLAINIAAEALKTAMEHHHPAEPAAEPSKNAPVSDGNCAMTSCGNEAPSMLTSPAPPYLAAGGGVEFYPAPGFEAVSATHPFAPFSIEASPPTPPPES